MDGTDERKAATETAAKGSAGSAGAPAEDARKARLAAALRENLKRRKAQARERRGPGEG